MVWPIPGVPVSTPYRRVGRLWRACGWHTGDDLATDCGTWIVAPISGTIRHRWYGAAFGPYQFAISPDPGKDPFGAGEVFFAHTLSRLPDGTRVTYGDRVAKVGSLGNSTGCHLHIEYHSAKNRWSCDVMRDPAIVMNWQPKRGWMFPKGHTIYLKYLRVDGHTLNDDNESDSIKALQEMLNKHSLKAPGNITLPATGKYLSLTDQVVRADQDQHLPPADPKGKSFVGPKQIEHLISATKAPYTFVDDRPSQPPQQAEKPVWMFPEGHKVYLSKLAYGQDDSDSVRALQEMLEIDVTGNYDDVTDAAVIAHQRANGFGDDPEGQSFVGPQQAAFILEASGAPYQIVDDRSEGRPSHPEGWKGIDIASYQAGIDIAALDGVDFVIVKLTEGVNYLSPHTEAQLAAAKASGAKIGLYHFARNDTDGSMADAVAEADFFLKHAQAWIGEAVLVLDWERPPYDQVDWAKAWLDRVYEKTQVRAWIYMSESHVNNADWTPISDAHPLWVAKYWDRDADVNWDMSHAGPEPVVRWPGGWTVWQWTSSGRLDGYNGDLDLNWAPSLTDEKWDAWARGDRVPDDYDLQERVLTLEAEVAELADRLDEFTALAHTHDGPTETGYLTANWPSRYKDGGLEADLSLWMELTADSRVVAVGLQEAWWLYNNVLRDVEGWTFVTARTSEGETSGEVLAVRGTWGRVLDTGSTMISPYTTVQPDAAGPTRHKEKHIVWADVEVDGEVHYVGNVHLAPSKHLGGAIYKLWKLQRDACVEWMGRQGDRCVLMGDFNCESSHNDAAPFREIGTIASAPSHGKRDIDWVVVKGDALVTAQALPNRGQSDHKPVLAVLKESA